MTATEARKKTAQAHLSLAEQQFQRCMEEIEKSISRGNYHAEVYDLGRLYQSTVEKLEDLGYKIRGCRILWSIK
jgi:hypothetical protein